MGSAIDRPRPPQLAVTAPSPPEGNGWLHEIEFDGDRLQALVEEGRSRLFGRGRRDWTDRFPALAVALSALPLRSAAFDGEVAFVDGAGRTDRKSLQRAVRKGATEAAVYFVFDLLEVDGEDLTDEPLARRKERLAAALAAAPPNGPIRASLHLACEGAAFLAQACAFGVPGIVSKRADAPYRSGRDGSWRKTPCPPVAASAPRLETRRLPRVRMTNADRVLYPEAGITKFDLAQFYADIADWILPHLRGRPLSIVRCPDGLKGPRFFQKHAGAAVAPSLVKRVVTADGVEPVLAVTDLNDLLDLVQISALEIHAWGSRLDAIERPDRLVIDLDPDPALSWSALVEGARDVRARLASYGLQSFLKTTGGKGLHVVAPLAPVLDWSIVKEFTRQLALQLATDSPARYTVAVPRAARRGKILIDYLRNARGSTAVAAFSTRATEDASVSVPLSWDEISSTIPPVRRTVRNLGERLAALPADPWRDIESVEQTIPRRIVETLRQAVDRQTEAGSPWPRSSRRWPDSSR